MHLNPNKHYVNKSKTKHYYLNHIFDNFEWKEFISEIKVQNISICINDKHRKIPITCERWYNQDNYTTTIARPCKNKVFYRSDKGGYFCKQCAHDIAKKDSDASFNRIKE